MSNEFSVYTDGNGKKLLSASYSLMSYLMYITVPLYSALLCFDLLSYDIMLFLRDVRFCMNQIRCTCMNVF